ncbi:hypothetical protein [Pseudoalteromonas luteoviolacea]|uniref:Uncharacterized protein n=1 Tax=Pseudoalteromonas luteoviolacea (strain 2ta16) TaxID=1353533 RepID=V4HW81_PSEL2|nr:hypothetical protein [Pseudoalteromonas luteoviolacea]ESP95075.1 hypothetical protein PL2TA16_04631 [Pseudoalteromonas luteoviolacea 2ta16]KZN34184.1 hypothetical protein N483_25565 [Pseudoalteromonas luteoviolacea NCIMB 1944]
MKRYRELIITIAERDIEQFSECLASAATKSWARNKGREDEALSFVGFSSKPYCFDHIINNEHIASLWLANNEEGGLEVSNIVPTKEICLSVSKYNSILESFLEKVISSAKDKVNFQVSITNEEFTLEDELSEEASQALRVFSSSANKSTGHAHPLDKKRWFHFINLAFKSSSEFDTDILEKFLVEDGWDEEKASKLTIDFEYSIGLLSSFVKVRGTI